MCMYEPPRHKSVYNQSQVYQRSPKNRRQRPRNQLTRNSSHALMQFGRNPSSLSCIETLVASVPGTSGGGGDVAVVEEISAAALQTFLSFIISSTPRASNGGFGRTEGFSAESVSLRQDVVGIPRRRRDDENETERCPKYNRP